jgi:type 1 glutamine amidotransferase
MGSVRSVVRLTCAALAAIVLLLATGAHASEPKKLLVVTVTTGFRHGSIATAEKVLEKLAGESKLFTVDFVRQPRARPQAPKRPQRASTDTDESFKAKEAEYKAEMEKIKPFDQAWLADVAKVLADGMSLEKLQNYDGVIFANTTGDLPLPNKDGFIQWLQSGKAFIGMHSATDTFHGFRPYIEMIGGEFDGHPWSQAVTVRVDDAGNPASKPFPKEFEINDEIYQFKSYSRADKDVLLQLDSSNEERPKVAPKKDATPLGFFQRGKRTDGDYAVSWVKTFGKGRVFYTSLGHRDQVWEDPRYQEHILGGIRWALDLK